MLRWFLPEQNAGQWYEVAGARHHHWCHALALGDYWLHYWLPGAVVVLIPRGVQVIERLESSIVLAQLRKEL